MPNLSQPNPVADLTLPSVPMLSQIRCDRRMREVRERERNTGREREREIERERERESFQAPAALLSFFFRSSFINFYLSVFLFTFIRFDR